MNEIWKDIPGYENRYQVSNLGRVKSLLRFTTHSNGRVCIIREKILSIFLDKKGYCKVTFGIDGKKFPQSVHRLVLLAFQEESELGVNHKDGNKQNNNLENLEYSTSRHNSNHLQHVIRSKERYGITFDKRKKLWVAQIVIEGKNIKLGRSKDKESAYKRFFLAYLDYHGVTPW